MPVDTQQILDKADELGKLIAQHPAVERYKQAQRAVTEDADASRLMADLNRQYEGLIRQEESGRPVTDAQRQALESLQAKIVSHIKIKAMNLAQVEFVDLLRKVSQTYQRQVAGAEAMLGGGGAAPPEPRSAASSLIL